MSEKNGDPLDLSDGSVRETDFTVDETSSSGTQPNNEGTTVDQIDIWIAMILSRR